MKAPRQGPGQAPVAEVFSSVQGEGPYVGVRQVFVRTYGCDLCCRYCDTPASRAETGRCLVEAPPGSRRWRELPNPLSAPAVADLIAELDQPRGLHHSVSFTGGEPLLHAAFVGELAERCHDLGLQTYLETNGQRVTELAEVISRIDMASIDIKLPSSQPEACRDEALLERSLQAIGIARHTQVVAKLVVTREVTIPEAERVASAVAQQAPTSTLVLQPVTPRGGVAAPDAEALLVLQAAAAARHPDVRMIPQCHLLMGQL